MAVYLVDSNFFIQAHRATYPIDVVPGFWTAVKRLADSGEIISIDKVKKEIYSQNDALTNWCKANLSDTFYHDTTTVMGEYGIVSKWANSKSSHYLPNAINEFLSADEADAYLVAYALADAANRIIITHERSEPNGKKKIKIPEPCDKLGVIYLNTIDMFRRLGVTF
jgi:hypothetical protein